MEQPILLVEDEENDVLFLRNAFRKVGITNPVQIAQNGREALDYLQGHGPFSDRTAFPFPCLVLLDLKLPYVMGLDVLRNIRTDSEFSGIVIVFSSSNSQEDIDDAFRYGANAYLVKPNDSAELVAIASAIRDFWLLQNQFPTPSEMPETPLNLRTIAERPEMPSRKPEAWIAASKTPDVPIYIRVRPK
jgi:two-component system response regulator